MKNFIAIITLVVISFAVAKTANADLGLEEAPLLSKGTFSGFVPDGLQRPKVCNIYSDRVEVTHGFGFFSVTETKAIELTGDIVASIKAAAGAPLESLGPVPCDGPSTYVTASVDGEDVTLASGGSCGGEEKKIRRGLHARSLLELAYLYCPQPL